MPTPSLDAHFGKEYRIAWDRAYDFARLSCVDEAVLIEKVHDCVRDIADALLGKEVHIALLALTHVVREHYLLPLAAQEEAAQNARSHDAS